MVRGSVPRDWPPRRTPDVRLSPAPPTAWLYVGGSHDHSSRSVSLPGLPTGLGKPVHKPASGLSQPDEAMRGVKPGGLWGLAQWREVVWFTGQKLSEPRTPSLWVSWCCHYLGGVG